MKHKIIGIRPGEKLHESLISKEEGKHVLEFKKYFIIQPAIMFVKRTNFNLNSTGEKGKKLAYDFEYTSFNNKKYLTLKEIKEL